MVDRDELKKSIEDDLKEIEKINRQTIWLSAGAIALGTLSIIFTLIRVFAGG